MEKQESAAAVLYTFFVFFIHEHFCVVLLSSLSPQHSFKRALCFLQAKPADIQLYDYMHFYLHYITPYYENQEHFPDVLTLPCPHVYISHSVKQRDSGLLSNQHRKKVLWVCHRPHRAYTKWGNTLSLYVLFFY